MLSKEKQFETLHSEYQGMVVQLCLGFMKGDEAKAKDLSQEVFIQAWNALENFEGRSSLKTWIYRIAVNTCLKQIRDEKKAHFLTLDDQMLAPAAPSSEAKPYQPLYNAIGKLAVFDRLIIMMVLDDLEYSEIAQVVGISEGNLRVKIHRIKKHLKKLLDHEKLI